MSTTRCSRCAHRGASHDSLSRLTAWRERLEGQGTSEMVDEEARQTPPHLGELEQAIMEILWQRCQATVREVTKALPRTPPPAYTTVATVMTRLVEKGMLIRSRAGKVDHYRPAYSSEEFSQRAAVAAVQQLVRAHGDVALAQFAAALERADPDRVARLRARYHLPQPDEAQPADQEEDHDEDA